MNFQNPYTTLSLIYLSKLSSHPCAQQRSILWPSPKQTRPVRASAEKSCLWFSSAFSKMIHYAKLISFPWASFHPELTLTLHSHNTAYLGSATSILLHYRVISMFDFLPPRLEASWGAALYPQQNSVGLRRSILCFELQRPGDRAVFYSVFVWTVNKLSFKIW